MLNERELIIVINMHYERLNDMADEYEYKRMKDYINGMEVALNRMN